MSNVTRTAQNGTAEATVAAGINIALVKYWGKAPGPDNRPAVGSLSLTLDAPGTVTRVVFEPGLAQDTFRLNDVDTEGAPVTRLLDEVRARAGVSTRARVESRNTVPTAAGLASSASGFAALGLAAWTALGLPGGGGADRRLDRRLVDLVRRGSGSAPRSLLGGFARIDVETAGVHPVEVSPALDVSLVIALCADGPKSVSSRNGMALCERDEPVLSGLGGLAPGRPVGRGGGHRGRRLRVAGRGDGALHHEDARVHAREPAAAALLGLGHVRRAGGPGAVRAREPGVHHDGRRPAREGALPPRGRGCRGRGPATRGPRRAHRAPGSGRRGDAEDATAPAPVGP